VRLDDGRIQSTDKLLGKNFGIILNDFDGNKKISDEYLDFLNKHSFKILNISGSHEKSNYENYIACEDTHTDMQIYCDKYECNAVILRPDKYVFDIFNFETESLDKIVATTIKSLEKTTLFN
jgi:hypothetical protein